MKYIPVTLLVPVPEELHQEIQKYLDCHSGWDEERFFTAAIALFLMQNGSSNKAVNRLYLETLFDFAA